MKLKFSRIQRLLSSREYRGVYDGGHKYVGAKLLIFYRMGYSNNPKLGITISKKWGKAHDRNRFKRVVREGYRVKYRELPLSIELNVHPRNGYQTLSSEEVIQELKKLVKTCGEAQLQSTESGRGN